MTAVIAPHIDHWLTVLRAAAALTPAAVGVALAADRPALRTVLARRSTR